MLDILVHLHLSTSGLSRKCTWYFSIVSANLHICEFQSVTYFQIRNFSLFANAGYMHVIKLICTYKRMFAYDLNIIHIYIFNYANLFLAQLARRVKWAFLITLRPASVVCRPSSLTFTKSSPLKLLGQIKLNLATIIIGVSS